MLNVTAVQPDGPGYLTVYPCGAPRPLASNVNFKTGDVVPNAVLAKIGEQGSVCVYTNAAVDLIVDINGYVPAGGSLGSVVPARALDSRPGGATVDGQYSGIGRQPAEAVVRVPVAGRGGVPTDAAAVMLNVTAVQPDGPGYLTVYPCGAPRPLASNVNFKTGDVVPNAVLAKIGEQGSVCVYTNAAVDLIVDINGYVPAGGSLGSVVPAWALDSRPGGATVDGQYSGIGRQPAEAVIRVPVAGRGGVPTDAAAVMLNVTAVQPDGPGYLTVYPCGAPRPLASNVNFKTGDVVPNAVLAKIGEQGSVCVYTNAAVDLIVDINGYST